MASPFRIWRKHQKALLAALALMAMISFVVLPIIMDMMGSSPARNPVVVSTNTYGDLHEAKLRTLRQNRDILRGILQHLQQAAVEAGGDPRAIAMVMYRIGSSSEEEVVDTWLMANRAEQLGLVVSDDTINSFLRDLTTAQNISSETVQQIMRSRQISEDHLFGMLRHELLAMQLQTMFGYSLGGVTPAQRWDYYQRLNRKAKVEVAPVPVAQFVPQVADPDDAVLKEFFEKHKSSLSDPTSSQPGFREPQRVALEYFKASLDAVEVSDEEIQKHYDEVKDTEFLREELPGADKKPSTEEAPAEGESAKVPAAVEGPQLKPEAGQPAEKPAEGKKEKDAAPAKEKTSSRQRTSPFRMAAFEQEGKEEESKEEPKPESPKEEPKPEPAKEEPKPEAAKEEMTQPEPPKEEPKPEPAKEDVAKPELPKEEPKPEPAKEEPKSEPPKEEMAKPEPPKEEPKAEPAKEDVAKPEPSKEEPKVEPQPKAEPAKVETAEPAVEPEDTKYIPLEKVKNRIRAKLAEAKVREILNRISDRVQRYQEELTLYEVHKEDKTRKTAAKPPEKPDFAKLARQHGFGFYRTELISALELMDLDIGQSTLEGNVSFARYVFETLPLHRPDLSQDIEGNLFLFWKTKQAEDRVPAFDDEGVRERVLRAWKLVQARGLARREAERLAEQARKAGKPLEEVFARQTGVVVHESEPFSWMTYGAFPAWWAQVPPEISRIRSEDKDAKTGAQSEIVDTPGNEFMRTVFRLDQGQIGVAMNQPETVVYVVRMAEVMPALWQAFLAEDFGRYARVAESDQRSLVLAWRESIREEVGLKWHREQDRQTGRMD